MMILKRGIPVTLAVLVGLVTLAGLLFVPSLADLILNWAGFLAAAALIMGILNLLSVHVKRGFEGNLYSVILMLSMLAVFGLAVTDQTGLTQNGVETVFSVIQVPLEAALASLLAFFLLFAGVRMMRERRNLGMILFLFSTLFFLLAQAPMPEPVSSIILPIRNLIQSIVVVSGIRGLLLGIALGVITLSVRLLTGMERPYSS